MRFAQRLKGEPEPTFADLQRTRQIDRLVGPRRAEIAALVALLDARPALDIELNGTRLGPLAQIVGEERFDLVCDAEIEAGAYARGSSNLPQPHTLSQRGENLLRSHQRAVDIAHLAKLAAAICDGGTDEDTVA